MLIIIFRFDKEMYPFLIVWNDDHTIINFFISATIVVMDIETAVKRLISNKLEQSQRRVNIQSAKAHYEKAKESQQKKEADAIVRFSEVPGDLPEATNQLLLQEVMKANIEEAIAHNQYMMTQMLYSLSTLIVEPETIDPKELGSTLVEIEQKLEDLKNEALVWFEHANRVVQQTGQILSLSEVKDVEVSSQLISLRKKIMEISQNNLLLLGKLESDLDDSWFIQQVVDTKNAALIGGIGAWIQETGRIFLKITSTTGEILGTTVFRIGNKPVTLLNLLRFFLIFIITFWVARIVVRTLKTITRRRKGIRKAVLYRINRLVYYLILFVGLFIGLWSLGFEFGNLILVGGFLGIVLGFGLQSIFNNFISGIIILFQSQLKIGDYIELESGLRGEIREINVRSTIITTNDGIDVLIPNSEIVTTRVINWTLREPYRRVHVPFSVAYGTDVDLVNRVVFEEAKKVPITLLKVGVPEPIVYLTKFGDSALAFELVVWVNERATRRVHHTQSAYLWAILKAFKKHDIKIPFPQRDLHLIDVPDEVKIKAKKKENK